MNKPQFQLPLILIIILVFSSAFAQPLDLKIPDPGNMQVVKLRSGSSVVGSITKVSDTEIEFQTTMGSLTIAIVNIKEISEVPMTSFRDGKYWFPNPNQTRLLIGPTGRTLKQGQGYFSDVWIFFPSIAYGFTDEISMGFGMTIFPGVSFEDQLKFFTPKLGLSVSDDFDFAVSALIMSVPTGDDEHANFGTLFANGTFGSADHSVTVGLGWGFIEDELSEKPVLQLGGETRFSRGMSFVTENWVFPGDVDPLLSGGVRFFGESIAVDFAFLTTLDGWAVPYLSFVYNF